MALVDAGASDKWDMSTLLEVKTAGTSHYGTTLRHWVVQPMYTHSQSVEMSERTANDMSFSATGKQAGGPT